MRRLVTLVFVTLAVAVGVFAAQALKCKYDRSPLHWDGKTRIEYSRTEYRCVCGSGEHRYWLEKADCSE